MTDVLPPLPPIEEPQPPPPPKRWFLFVCDVEHPTAVLGSWTNQVMPTHPTIRRATAADLERMGFVRKGEP